MQNEDIYTVTKALHRCAYYSDNGQVNVGSPKKYQVFFSHNMPPYS